MEQLEAQAADPANLGGIRRRYSTPTLRLLPLLDILLMRLLKLAHPSSEQISSLASAVSHPSMQQVLTILLPTAPQSLHHHPLT